MHACQFEVLCSGSTRHPRGRPCRRQPPWSRPPWAPAAPPPGTAEIEERHCAQHGLNSGQVIIWCPLKWVLSLPSGFVEKAWERREKGGTPPHLRTAMAHGSIPPSGGQLSRKAGRSAGNALCLPQGAVLSRVVQRPTGMMPSYLINPGSKGGFLFGNITANGLCFLGAVASQDVRPVTCSVRRKPPEGTWKGFLSRVTAPDRRGPCPLRSAALCSSGAQGTHCFGVGGPPPQAQPLTPLWVPALGACSESVVQQQHAAS